jgi:hypothetical protein
MRCVMCNRHLAKAAATMPAGHDQSEPFRSGPVGPTCARRAGLLGKPSLFSRKRVKRTARPRTNIVQRDWLREEIAA